MISYNKMISYIYNLYFIFLSYFITVKSVSSSLSFENINQFEPEKYQYVYHKKNKYITYQICTSRLSELDYLENNYYVCDFKESDYKEYAIEI